MVSALVDFTDWGRSDRVELVARAIALADGFSDRASFIMVAVFSHSRALDGAGGDGK